MRKNVLEYLESSARMHADKPAFCDENRVFTFGELLKAASRASKATDYLVEDCFIPKLGKDYFKSPEPACEAVADVDMERDGVVETEQGDEGFSLDELCESKCDEADIANSTGRNDAASVNYEEGR